MDASELRDLLEEVRAGRVDPDEAINRLRWLNPFVETGNFAKVDIHRRLRCGFPEVVFGQGKTPEQVSAIFNTLKEHGQGCMATRITPDTATFLKKEHPEGHYNEVARIFQISGPVAPGPKEGKVVVVTAGTSDLPVAEEAKITAEAWNCEVVLVADVGVAGLHRLLGQVPILADADVIVVVAGMEGALPSVVGGLVDCPVIAVPTTIGYGAHFQGLAPLLTMLNSCASNVVVVNIDSGFNAGHVAGVIARRAGRARAGTKVTSATSQHSAERPPQ